MTLVESIVYSGGTKPQIAIYYDDVSYIEYICDADAWVALSEAKRRVRRITKDSGGRTLTVKVADSGEFKSVATDLSAVAALTYA